ncbi:Uncharacterized protein HZ326_26059 [Fusarium oxysporum f. sp. albedinis]|nr:Uncharacterized protein HZ326_26059 [Fusarium oxysporum f. sp. albedinis]
MSAPAKLPSPSFQDLSLCQLHRDFRQRRVGMSSARCTHGGNSSTSARDHHSGKMWGEMLDGQRGVVIVAPTCYICNILRLIVKLSTVLPDADKFSLFPTFSHALSLDFSSLA